MIESIGIGMARSHAMEEAEHYRRSCSKRSGYKENKNNAIRRTKKRSKTTKELKTAREPKAS